MTQTDDRPSVDATLKERGQTYTDFTVNASVAQRLKEVLRRAIALNPQAEGLHNNEMRVLLEGLDLIATKLSRVVTGDPRHLDNYVDIGGYAKLMEDRMGGNDGQH